MAEVEQVKAVPVDSYKWENIVAKPLVSQDFTSVKSKNPNLAFFWGNRVVGQPSGTRISQLEAAGFAVATPADCDVPGLKPYNGHWQYGDLLLMKIAKGDYWGALKYNEQVSRERLKTSTAANRGLKESRGMTTKSMGAKKLQFIQPTEEERNALFNKAVQEAK